MTLAALFGDRQNDLYTYGKCSAMTHISQKQFHEFALSWPGLTFLGPESRKEFQKYAKVCKSHKIWYPSYLQKTDKDQCHSMILWFWTTNIYHFCMISTMMMHDDYIIYKEESSFKYSSTRTHRKGWYLNYWILCFSLHLCLVTIATRAVCGFCNLCAMVRSFRSGRWWWRWLWWLLRSKKNVEKGDVEVLDIWLIWLYQHY